MSSIQRHQIAALKEWALEENVVLSDEIAAYLTARVTSNDRRELQGLLIRLVEYSSLHGQTISLSLAERVCHQLDER
jgi:chromosomal replication initiation ATPase DnaA